MSQTEETTTPSEQPEAKNDPLADFADELEIVDAMKPAPAPTSNNKPLKYGNRKKKAGESAPAIQNLSSISSFEEEEEIEMDDLPIRATASEELIDTRKAPSEPREEYGERRPRRGDRSRGERRERTPRERAPKSEETSETENTEAAASEDRPERFGTVNRDAASNVQEFRPSRDGRTAPKRERKPRSESSSPRSTPTAVKKKGLLAKIVSFFTGGDKEEEEKQERSNRGGQRRGRGGRGRRGPNNRQSREGEGEGSENRRRRRPRSRKPRAEGEDGNRSEGQNRDGRQRRRRRSRRPRREGGPRRERQESASE